MVSDVWAGDCRISAAGIRYSNMDMGNGSHDHDERAQTLLGTAKWRRADRHGNGGGLSGGSPASSSGRNVCSRRVAAAGGRRRSQMGTETGAVAGRVGAALERDRPVLWAASADVPRDRI